MLKNFWITNKGSDYISLSFESDRDRLTVNEVIFPENCEEKRHVIILNVLSESDLIRILKTINVYIKDMMES
jgi:hypothetical protein